MLTDQSYLKNDQYRDSSNLDARAGLHARFSTNHYGWHRWVFDQFDIADNAYILEIGCGPAFLWEENLARVPAGWQITLSDLSAGMLESARPRFAGRRDQFRFEVVDVQEIPFADNTYDAVIANHMLYHVPNRAKAIAEIHRILKPGGQFYAATNGKAHLKEMIAMFEQVGLPDVFGTIHQGEFRLEDGADELHRQFPMVTLLRYPDALVVPKVEPLVAYARSVVKRGQAEAELDAFRRLVEAEIAARGAVHITKDSGLFIARK